MNAIRNGVIKSTGRFMKDFAFLFVCCAAVGMYVPVRYQVPSVVAPVD